MDIQYLKEVVGFMSEFMNEHGFSSENLELGNFNGELKTYKIAYNEQKREFSVSVSPLDSDGNPGTYTTLSSWFFDEADHGAKDTECIADDFTEAIAADTGIQIVRTQSGAKEVAMPEKAAVGTEPGMEAFAQKFLALFPQYKDSYKDMMVKYGDFLYVEFFKRYGVEKMRELLKDEAKNKKQLTKYFDMLGEMFYEGEGLVGDVVCSVILAGAFGDHPDAFDAAAEKYLGEYTYLKTYGKAAVRNYKHDKKLREALKY